MSEAFIIDAVRTPRGIGKPGKGALVNIHPQHLAATVLSALQVRNNVNTADIDDAPALEMRTFCDSLGLDPRAVHAMRRLSDGHWFLRTGEELATHGLQVQLGAYEAQVYMDWRVLWGDDARTLCHRLNGGGVYDLDGALASVAAERAAPAETEDDVPVDEDADDVEVDDPEVGEE